MMIMESTRRVLGHLLLCLLVRSHRSLIRSHRALIRLLHTARFARAPLRSFARLLAQSLAPALVGQWNIFVQFSMCPESQWNDYEIDA